MNNYRREQREYAQSYYGGYCNKCREKDLEPIPYHIFADELQGLFIFNNKAKMIHLLCITKLYWRNKNAI